MKIMDDNYIRYGVNIGVTGDDDFYKFMTAVKPHKNRIGSDVLLRLVADQERS